HPQGCWFKSMWWIKRNLCLDQGCISATNNLEGYTNKAIQKILPKMVYRSVLVKSPVVYGSPLSVVLEEEKKLEWPLARRTWSTEKFIPNAEVATILYDKLEGGIKEEAIPTPVITAPIMATPKGSNNDLRTTRLQHRDSSNEDSTRHQQRSKDYLSNNAPITTTLA
ncbi:7050_t:CDS:2, partial [Dentiscutata erythropus]